VALGKSENDGVRYHLTSAELAKSKPKPGRGLLQGLLESTTQGATKLNIRPFCDRPLDAFQYTIWK
jgi:hypothetical protein